MKYLERFCLGESALDYIHDAIARKIVASPKILPRYGKQYAVLVECEHLRQLTSTYAYKDIDLSMINSLRDTASVIFTKQYGFRLSSVPIKPICEPIEVFEVDFAHHQPGFLPLREEKEIEITLTGSCDAMIFYWEAYERLSEDKLLKISTSPFDTKNSFCRDLQWGQAVQIVDLQSQGMKEKNSIVEEGDRIRVTQRASKDSVLLQYSFQRI